MKIKFNGDNYFTDIPNSIWNEYLASDIAKEAGNDQEALSEWFEDEWLCEKFYELCGNIVPKEIAQFFIAYGTSNIWDGGYPFYTDMELKTTDGVFTIICFGIIKENEEFLQMIAYKEV